MDLPGYGFAKVSKTEREYWGQLISAYLSDRKSLIGLILLSDSRHGIKPLDEQLIGWSKETRGSFSVDMLAGGHFFIHEHEAKVLKVIKDQLEGHHRRHSLMAVV